MDRRRVDVAVIGAGTAGLNARKEVERAGKSWLLIESGPYGTTCARVGCMPSKLLIAASEAAHEARRASLFGVEVGRISIDGRSVMTRVREERDRFAGAVVRATEKLPEEGRIRGQARFVAPTRLVVDDHTEIEAGAVVIATGSRPFLPDSLDSVADRVMTSDDLFELEELPESMAIIGTGLIALELGQALARLGIRVAFFNPFEEVGMLTDPVLQREVREIFAAELTLRLGVAAEVAPDGDRGVAISWQDDGRTRCERFARVLAAAGRRPNVEGLDLKAAGLALGPKGVPEHDERTMQCGASPIFIAGDACGHRPLLHESSDEGRIAGANAARYPDVVASERRTSLAIAFTDPQLASVGAPFSALSADRIAIGEVSYDDQGRARVIAKNRGRVRLYGERESCRLVGAELVGPRMEHMAHLLAWAIQLRLRVDEVLKLPFYHPNLEEGLRTGLRDLARELAILGRCRPEDLATQPGS